MPDRIGQHERTLGLRKLQNVRPTLEPEQNNDRRRQKAFQHRNRFHARADVGDQFFRCGFCARKITAHAIGICQKVHVVAVIHQPVKTLLVRFAEKFFVRHHGGLVATRRG